MVLETDTIMFLWFMAMGAVLGMPTDEFKEFSKIEIGDFMSTNHKSNIVPGFLSANQQNRYTASDDNDWLNLIILSPSNKYFKQLDIHIQKGTTSKGLTFSIYDDNMREAALALFRLFQTTEGELFEKLKEWAKKNINKEMYMYALRLESLYSSKTKDSTLTPPFIWNPNYFVNSEALAKASLIAQDLVTTGEIDSQVANADQYSYASASMKEFVIINSNYSGWNLPKSPVNDGLNYFREDVSLNSYYLGVHLSHPFWMSNEELELFNPKYAENYYYAHQQLLARYSLEKQHIQVETESLPEMLVPDRQSSWDYIPYLRYKNGLPFPTRPCLRGDMTGDDEYVKKMDIAIRECISRGLIIMENGTTLIMKDDSHIDILAKLIRANIDGVKFAKIIRNRAGYGGNSTPIDEYNPAPSLLHHPETSLRDPVYWELLKYVLFYFNDYKSIMEPFDLREYETEDFEIVDNEFSKLVTYFDYYRFPVNLAISNDIRDDNDVASCIAVRQRRLSHLTFSMNFTVVSTVEKDAVVRLYLGPRCGSDSKCWDKNNYNTFYELDTFPFTLEIGTNHISWSPETSDRLSYDYEYNSVAPRNGSKKYSIYKFPDNLIIPRGLEDGLNLTLFVMITPADDNSVRTPPRLQNRFSKEMDSKPLGFPFHRQAKGFNEGAYNYKFYNISIYHKSQPVDNKGFFSPHLY